MTFQNTTYLSLVLLLLLAASVKALGLFDRRGILASFTSTSVSLTWPSNDTYDAKGDPKNSPSLSAEGDLAPVNFSGVYRDPKHKNGCRVIRSGGPGQVLLALQDEPGGPVLNLKGTSSFDKATGETKLMISVPKNSSRGNEEYPLPATFSPDKLLSVNFCDSKGEILTKGSISFEDGNVWIKDTGLQGVYVDPFYPDGYRVVRELGNGKVAVDLANAIEQRPIRLPAVINKAEGKLVVDFSPISGERWIPAEIKGDQLVFNDGKQWTKL